MKRSKRVMAMLLAFVMAFTMLPVYPAAVVSAEEPSSGEETSTMKETEPYFMDVSGNSYYLQYPEQAYKGEKMEVRLMMQNQDKTEKSQVNALESGFKVFYASSKKELETDAQKGVYIFSYDEFINNDRSAGLSMTVPDTDESTYYEYDSNYTYGDDLNVYYGYDNNDPETRYLNPEWKLPVTISAAGIPAFSLTDSSKTIVDAPEVLFADGVDATKYQVSYNWYGAEKTDEAGLKAKVNRNYYSFVSCSVYVKKIYINTNGDERTYSITDRSVTYIDQSDYQNVKLAEKTEETSGDIYTYYLRYLKDIYNGDSLRIRYARVKGTDITAAESVESISPSNSTLAVSENQVGTLEEGIDNNNSYTDLDYTTFVRTKKEKDEEGNVISEETTYPTGEKSYTLFFGEDATIDGVALSPSLITLNWLLPGQLDVATETKELVTRSSEKLLTPVFSKTEGVNDNTTYRTNYSWFYKDSKDAEWKQLTTGNCYPNKNGYYLCKVTLSKNSTKIWEDEQEYHVSLVDVRPAGFYNANVNSLLKDMSATVLVSVGQDVSIQPDVQTADGYDVTFQWYKDDKALAGENDTKLILHEIKMEDLGTYKLVAKANLKGDQTPCYEATYSANVKLKPYIFENNANTWTSENRHLTLSLGVGDTIDATIPLVVDDSYKAEYQWYRRVYQAVTDYWEYDQETDSYNDEVKYQDWDEVTDKSVQVTDEEGNISYKTIYILAKYEPISGQTKEGLENYTLTNNNFVQVLTNSVQDRIYTMNELSQIDRETMFLCKVKVTGPEDYETSFNEYLDIEETYRFEGVYSPEQSDGTIVVDEGADVIITAPKYVIDGGYQVLYQWQKWVCRLDENGEPVWDDEEDDYVYEWQNVGEASTSNILKLEKVTQPVEYRVSIIPARKDSVGSLSNADTVNRYYDIRILGESAIEHIFRTTDGKFFVKLGEQVSMGVEAVLANSNANSQLSYQWYHNGKIGNADKGEKMEDAKKATYTIEKVDARSFGDYICEVKAVDSKDGSVIDTKTIRFTVTEDTGIIITSPTSDVVAVKKVGDKVKLHVEATSELDDKLSYSWYRIDRDTTSKTYEEQIRIDGAEAADYELSLTEKDFTTYICRISNSRGGSVNRSFSVINETLTDVVQAKNGVTVIDKKAGETVDLTVESKSETAGGTFTYQWYKDGLKISGETKESLHFEKLEESQFGSYRCEWSYVKGNFELAGGYVVFDLQQIADEITDIFEGIAEYGEDNNGGRNRVQDTIEFGVKPAAGNHITYTYQWSFIDETSYNRGVRTEQILKDKTSSDMKVKLTEADFGVYCLYVYDKDGNRVYPSDENGNDIRTSFRVFQHEEEGTLTLDNQSVEIIQTKPGQSVTLTVDAKSTTTDPINYQWFKYNEVNDEYEAIYEATATDYELKNLKENDFGSYMVSVECGNTRSSKQIEVSKTANLKVERNILPGWYNEYRFVFKKNAGDDITFEVNATADPEYEIVYQWYKGGADGGRIRIQGADAKSLTISDISDGDYNSYYCIVRAGVDVQEVQFDLRPVDAFLNIVMEYSDGEVYILTPDEKDYHADTNFVSVGEEVTLAPDVRSSAQPSYQWYHYDKVQNRYVKIDGATNKTYDATVTAEDVMPDKVANINDYKCVISTAFRTIEYRMNFMPAEEYPESKNMTVASVGAYVYDHAYGTTALENSVMSYSSRYMSGYALEGAAIKLIVTDEDSKEGRTYQWYEKNNAGEYTKLVGQTGLEYSFTAPMVKRVQPGDGKKQNDLESNMYYCAALEDGEIVSYTSYDLYSIKMPDQLDRLPKAYLYGNSVRIDGSTYGYCDVKGYRTPAAQSQTFQFADKYEKRAELVVFDKNGNFAVYDNEHEIAGQTLKVNTDTAVFFYYYTEYDDTAWLTDLVDMVASGKPHGYAASLAKDTAVYDREVAEAAAVQSAKIAAEQAKAVASEAEKQALTKQVQQAMDTANEAKTIAQKVSVGSTGQTGGTGSTGVSSGSASNQNPVTAIKAKKKTVTVKAGKTVTVTFNLTTGKKNLKTTDKVTTKLSGKASSGAKVTKTTISKTTVKVKVKTNKKKKGTMKLKVNAGNKNETVTIKVK